eukprot:2409535-Rhodomonas_salina.1
MFTTFEADGHGAAATSGLLIIASSARSCLSRTSRARKAKHTAKENDMRAAASGAEADGCELWQVPGAARDRRDPAARPKAAPAQRQGLNAPPPLPA